MTKFDQWPLWVQVVVGIPHAALITVMAWIWIPKTSRDWLQFTACLAYLLLFYFIFVH